MTSNTPRITLVQRDSQAWRMQVWASFTVALGLCAGGLLRLPGDALNAGFMVMGYLFSLTSVFVLSKFVRDRQAGERDTPMWGLVAWGGFAISMLLTGWGLLRMDLELAHRAYLGIAWLFLVSSAFTLAKMLRDRHEADLVDGVRRGEPAYNETPAEPTSN